MSTQPGSVFSYQYSIQSQVLDAVVARLGGAPANVFRCQMEAFTADQLPADNVFPESESAEYADTYSIDLKHRFFVRHLVQAADQADQAADLRYVRAARLLLADPTLGRLVRYTRYLGRKWEREPGEVETLACVVTYEVEFSTRAADPGPVT